MIGGSNLTYHTYSWTPTAGRSDPTVSNPIATVTGNVTYIVTMTDEITGCSASDTIVISVNPTPVVTLPADTVLWLLHTRKHPPSCPDRPDAKLRHRHTGHAQVSSSP